MFNYIELLNHAEHGSKLLKIAKGSGYIFELKELFPTIIWESIIEQHQHGKFGEFFNNQVRTNQNLSSFVELINPKSQSQKYKFK